MSLPRLPVVLPLVVASVLSAGVVLITLRTSALVSEIGVLLVILGLMGLMPIVRLHLTTEPAGV